MRPHYRLPRVFVSAIAALIGSAAASLLLAQAPAAPAVPEALKPAFAVLQTAYPKVEAKRAPKRPADTVWIFRSERLGEGTIEAGFEGNEVVYLIFRRATGGGNWKPAEIKALHMNYHRNLLHEVYDPVTDTFYRYNHLVTPQINAAVITRKDFDAKALLSGL